MQDKNILLQSLTDNERWIIETLRSLQPHEFVQIQADKAGKINNFLVIRSSKIILTDDVPVRVGFNPQMNLQ